MLPSWLSAKVEDSASYVIQQGCPAICYILPDSPHVLIAANSNMVGMTRSGICGTNTMQSTYITLILLQHYFLLFNCCLIEKVNDDAPAQGASTEASGTNVATMSTLGWLHVLPRPWNASRKHHSNAQMTISWYWWEFLMVDHTVCKPLPLKMAAVSCQYSKKSNSWQQLP